MYSFVRSYAETGMLIAIYDLSALLVLPIIGHIADRMGGKKLLILSLFLYPLIGLNYFTAGRLQLPIFIIIARLLN
jgi:MFS family permease